MNEYQTCALLGIAVFILRRTDALYFYARSFGMVDEKYLKARKEGENFLDWLNKKKDNFFTELLVCPFCITTWLAVIPAIFFNWANYPFYWCGILVFYGIWAGYKALLTKMG